MLNLSSTAARETHMMYLDEIYDLSKCCYQLIATDKLDDIHAEYKRILKEKNFSHQFISHVMSDGHILGCIDPIYRRGRPLKHGMDSRHMILAMCDFESLSNSNVKALPIIRDIKVCGVKPHIPVKVEKIEMIPLSASQCKEVHFTFRPFIEFDIVDTFGPLQAVRKSFFQGGVEFQVALSSMQGSSAAASSSMQGPSAAALSSMQGSSATFPQINFATVQNRQIQDFYNFNSSLLNLTDQK
jgi:hypothetical protein